MMDSYFMMELQNGNLNNRIKEKKESGSKFETDLILVWLKKIMNGINFLHKNKIIHYGIDPKFVCCSILLFFPIL